MKILLTGAFNYSEEQIKKIENAGYEIQFIQDESEEIKSDVSEIEVVICNNLFSYNKIEKFKSLKVIHLTSAGFDRVPMDYIVDHNIRIFNAKAVYSIPMAEWVILKILEIYKNTYFFYENQKEHLWKKNRKLLELTDKKVGIIGFGSVGLEISKRLQAFNTSVIAINRSVVESEYIDQYVPLNQLNNILPELDIIILTVAMTEETKHMIKQDEINLMKDDSVLINVARGELINEKDLVIALKKEKFLGVSLDVFEEEPLDAEHLFWDLNNVFISPHNSYVSEQNNNKLFELIYKNLTNK